MKRVMKAVPAGLLTILVTALAANAEIKVSDNFSIYGDGRARYEMDERDPNTKDERDRFRYRLRVGFSFMANEYVEFGGRVATGSPDDQFSPHEILGASGADTAKGDFKKDTISIDKAYVKGKYMDGWAWFGKNSIPLWTQNEYFWDADVNPEGIAAGYTLKDIGPLSLTLQAGSFVVKEASWEEEDDDDQLTTYQAVVNGKVDPINFTLAYGVTSFNYDVTTTKEDTDYSLASAQVKVTPVKDLGIALGYDYMKSDADDDDTGSVVNVGLSYANASVSYRSIDIEKNASSPYPQDDFPNLGSVKPGFDGYEIALAYKITKNMNVEIKRFDGEEKDTDYEETRNQINFNVSF